MKFLPAIFSRPVDRRKFCLDSALLIEGPIVSAFDDRALSRADRSIARRAV